MPLIHSRRWLLRSGAAAAVAMTAMPLLAACGGAATGSVSATTTALASSVTSAAATTVPASAQTSSSLASAGSAATSSQSSSATASTSAGATTSATVAPSTSRVAAAPGELRYTTQNVNPPFADLEEKVTQAFQQQNPGVKVSYELFKGDDLQQKLVVLAAGGTSPDAADIETKWMPGFSAQKMLLDLTAYADRAKITASDYFPQEWAKAHIGGKLLIMPLDLQPIVFFYNKDLFAARGVPLPPTKWDDPSWTWDELLARSQKLTSGAGSDRVFGVNIPRDWRESLEVIWGNGGSVLNADHSQSTMTMAATTDAIQYRADLINKYHVQPNPDEQKVLGDFILSFINAKVGMIANNSTEAFYIAAKKSDLNYDMAPMPGGKAGAFTRNPSDSVMVAAGTRSPDAAFALAAFVTGEYGQGELVAKAGLGVPPYRKVAESDDFLKPQQPGAAGRNFQMVLDMMEGSHYKYAPVTTVYPDMVKILQPAHDKVLLGQISAVQMGQQVDGPINELLKKVPEEARGFLGD